MIKYILTVLSVVTTLSPVSASTLSAPTVTVENGSAEIVIAQSGQKELVLWVTAYSSTPEETDNTPFTTALGTKVHDGIIATNILPFGTKIKIPALFGDKIFVVEDRMHPRKGNFLDVWMPSKKAAEDFGINYEKVIVIN